MARMADNPGCFGLSRKHIKTHMNTLHCVHCSFTTAEKREMQNHFDAIHGERRLYQCPYCAKKIRYKKWNVHRHVQNKHPSQPIPAEYERVKEG